MGARGCEDKQKGKKKKLLKTFKHWDCVATDVRGDVGDVVVDTGTSPMTSSSRHAHQNSNVKEGVEDETHQLDYCRLSKCGHLRGTSSLAPCYFSHPIRLGLGFLSRPLCHQSIPVLVTQCRWLTALHVNHPVESKSDIDKGFVDPLDDPCLVDGFPMAVPLHLPCCTSTRFYHISARINEGTSGERTSQVT